MCLQRVTTQNENIVKYMSILIFEKLVDLFCRTFLTFFGYAYHVNMLWYDMIQDLRNWSISKL